MNGLFDCVAGSVIDKPPLTGQALRRRYRFVRILADSIKNVILRLDLRKFKFNDSRFYGNTIIPLRVLRRMSFCVCGCWYGDVVLFFSPLYEEKTEETCRLRR